MIYNTRDMWIGRSISLYGEYSESEVELFRDVLKQSDVVLDVGANIGTHTLAFSEIVGPTGKVFAFEPERFNFNTLAGNLAINNILNVYPVQTAIADEPGAIAVPELDHNSTFNFGGIELKRDYSKNIYYSVPKMKIDKVILERCNLIKIDIEGMECEALIGAEETIKKFKPMLYVENDRPDNTKKIIKTIRSHNYEIYQHEAMMYNPNNYERNTNNVLTVKNEFNQASPVVSKNLFCYHRESVIQVDFAKHGLEEIV